MSDAIGKEIDRSGSAEGQSNVMAFFVLLAEHQKLVVLFPLLAACVAAAISFALPEVYKANTRLMPPQQAQSGAAALLAQFGGMAGAAAGIAGIKSPNDLYIGMLRSRTVADQLIAQFDLKQHYHTPSQESARILLAENTTIASGKDGLITIEVEDRDKRFVANLANAYVQKLLGLTSVLAITEASQRRVFFEKQLERSKNNLADSESALKKALQTNGVVSVDSESRAILETVGRLRAEISAKEIQLGSMRAFVTEGNQDFKRVQQELVSLRSELVKLENGRPLAERGDAAASNAGGLSSVKILRDVKYHQMLFDLLARQYEAARLDEAKDTPSIQVLDAAVEPERRARPKRALIVLTTFAAIFFLAILLVFALENRQRILRDPARRAQWQRLRMLLTRR